MKKKTKVKAVKKVKKVKVLISKDKCIGILKKRGTFVSKRRNGSESDRKLSLEELNKKIG